MRSRKSAEITESPSEWARCYLGAVESEVGARTRDSVKRFTAPSPVWSILEAVAAEATTRRRSGASRDSWRGSGGARARGRGDGEMAQAREGAGRRASGVGLGVVAIVLCLVLRGLGAFQSLELGVYDRLLRAGAGRAEGASPVVGIPIGEAEFRRYGYPIPDHILAEAIRALGDAGAAAIGIDLYRDGPASDAPDDLAGWAALQRAVADNPRVVASELLPSADEPGTPPPDFASAAQIGFNNLLMDHNRVVRRGYMIAWDEVGNAHQSLTLRLALLHLARHQVSMSPDPERADWVRLGETHDPPARVGLRRLRRSRCGRLPVPARLRARRGRLPAHPLRRHRRRSLRPGDPARPRPDHRDRFPEREGRLQRANGRRSRGEGISTSRAYRGPTHSDRPRGRAASARLGRMGRDRVDRGLGWSRHRLGRGDRDARLGRAGPLARWSRHLRVGRAALRRRRLGAQRGAGLRVDCGRGCHPG